jgi:hypothetical protein
MKKEDYYNRDKSYSYKIFVICLIAIVSITLILLFTKCESPQAGGYEECCWKCAVSTKQFYPGKSPYEVELRARYEFCDCPDETIKNWEIVNTWTDTINGIKTVQIAQCKK